MCCGSSGGYAVVDVLDLPIHAVSWRVEPIDARDVLRVNRVHRWVRPTGRRRRRAGTMAPLLLATTSESVGPTH